MTELGVVLVSARGIANHLASAANDDAQFGPDSPRSSGGLTRTSGLQEALVFAATEGPRVVRLVNKGTPFPISEPVVLPSNLELWGAGGTLLNVGSLETPLTSSPTELLQHTRVHNLTVDSSGNPGGGGVRLYSPQNCVFDLEVNRAEFGLDVRARQAAATTGVRSHDNSSLNRFLIRCNEIHCSKDGAAGVAVRLSGEHPSPERTAVVTNNLFEVITATRVQGVGLEIPQWADTNHFLNAFISLVPRKDASGAILNHPCGVVLGSEANPPANLGVYNERFDMLAVDAYGFSNTPQVTGVKFNSASRTVIEQFYTSYGPPPNEFPGTRFDFGRSQSYFVRDCRDTGAGALPSGVVTYSKGFRVPGG